ncbi:hypothetical protein [Rubrivivax rivuli]|uniref:Uncharacterized protein n=1 Tax=Rubrivivax rivuli TaxID=1862385 RepID=A0A437RR58_9BURK|nr:hypothetical protein [Rubrivivax rivuli]RVU49286.1 hypothetical protein EOE66_01550 [Rubrivivax rivuli]
MPPVAPPPSPRDTAEPGRGDAWQAALCAALCACLGAALLLASCQGDGGEPLASGTSRSKVAASIGSALSPR